MSVTTLNSPLEEKASNYRALGYPTEVLCYTYTDIFIVATLCYLPLPCEKKSLQRAMGFFSYYSKWIPNFSETISPLVRFSNFPLGKEAIASFNKLKELISKSAVVSIDENIPFLVETDASDSAIAATLSQEGRPVAFYSKTLQGSEIYYAAVEKEAKAVVEAIQHWRHFLTNKEFTLKTDQKSVSYMFDTKKKKQN